MRILGIDLAWREETIKKPAKETGVCAVCPNGEIQAADWTVGIDATVDWIQQWSESNTLLMIDAPLVIPNQTGIRHCERRVGQEYSKKWRVSANATNLKSKYQGGRILREKLALLGWQYSDGTAGPCKSGRLMTEVYPYTTIVGSEELGYDDAKPIYKRKPSGIKLADFRKIRAVECDELIRRLASLADCSIPLLLTSNANTKRLLDVPSPLDDDEYKHREDLIDAVICAWTGLLWLKFGHRRCHVLGADDKLVGALRATIIAPKRGGNSF